jgi:pyruvate formate lyase activating enzyme
MGELGKVRGVVFDAERFSLHDGPGLRTCLFFKGCGLHCGWCSNPESQRRTTDIAVFVNQCFGCGDCLLECEPGALKLEAGKVHWTESVCDRCGNCVRVCAANAIQTIGEELGATEALGRILRDAAFFRQGGGVTLTGGEPALQPAFAEAVLRLAREEGLHTAMETCGYAPWSDYEPLLPHLNLVLFDIKHMDPVRHKQATGVDNERILENARRIADSRVPTIIRVPLIPGFNANRQDLSAIAGFVNGLKNVREIHLLPYHTLGRAKYQALGRDYPMRDVAPLKPEEAEAFADVIRGYGLSVLVGG